MSVRARRDTEWLLLTMTLPTKRASQRVEIWRKLQKYGAVPLGNSGYLLPDGFANEERFQWLATSIHKYGGDASIVHVRSIKNVSTSQLVGRFAEARAREYQELIRDIAEFSSMPLPNRSIARLSRLRARFHEIVEVDFFNSPLQKHAADLLSRAAEARVPGHKPEPRKVDPREYSRRLWVTRPRPGVDRSASAWLIRGYIDANARFTFAPEDRVPSEAVPFDMYQGGFGHRGDDCTFETLRKEFKVQDARVKVLSEIIHDADLADGKFGRKEGYGVDEILKGWAKQGIPDQELLARGMQLIEGLFHAIS
jgi:hypothetical protein